MDQPEKIKLEKTSAVIDANNVMLDHSSLVNVCMRNVSITDANLSDLHVNGAQMGGAHFENIGMPPINHPMYDPKLEQRPLKFENCDLHISSFQNCDLSNVQITNCNIKGLQINGISIDKLLEN